MAALVARVIRGQALRLSVAPLEMRAGMDTLIAQVVLVHDGQEIRLACRRLRQGRFHWAAGNGSLTLSEAQFDALVLGLPWQQLRDDGKRPAKSSSRSLVSP